MLPRLAHRCAFWLCGCAGFFACVTPCPAQFANSGVPGAQQGDVHNPSSRSYLPLLPNQPIQYSAPVTFTGHRFGRHYHFSGYSPGYASYPWLGSGYYLGTPGYWNGSPFYSGPYVLPPLVVPAQTMFGPQVAQQFAGGNDPIAARVDIVERRVPAEPKPVHVRVTNAETKARAGKFVEIGDNHFGKQKYHEALSRYRTASEIASDMPEVFFRQGFTLVALGQYDAAAKAFRRGLALRDDWSQSGFRLDQIYGADQLAKTAQLETLAKAADNNGQDANLMLLLGLMLYFDGQRDRAEPFFVRAADLGGNEDGRLKAFLPPPGPNPGQTQSRGFLAAFVERPG